MNLHHIREQIADLRLLINTLDQACFALYEEAEAGGSHETLRPMAETAAAEADRCTVACEYISDHLEDYRAELR